MRETALQGALVLAKSGRLEVGDNIYGHYTFCVFEPPLGEGVRGNVR